MASSKRQRSAEDRMHPAMEAAMRALVCPVAIDMATGVSSACAIGMQCRAGSVSSQAADAKRHDPGAVVLLRVGDCFYEAFGVDAVLLVEHCGATPVKARSGACKELRVCVRHDRIQSILNGLLRARHVAVVYEESNVLVTPRQRVFAQRVCRAQPTYAHALDSDAATERARPVVAVAGLGTDAWDVALCDVQLRQVRTFWKVDRSTTEALVARAVLPIVCVRGAPAFLASAIGSAGIVIVGSTAESTVEARLLSYVAAVHRIPEDEFARVPACVGACAPPPRFTLQHLGIDDSSGNTPSLVDACCTKRAPAHVRHQLHEWLSSPPSYSREIAVVVGDLTTCPRPLPELQGGRAGRWRGGLQAHRIDILTGLVRNAKAAAAVLADGYMLPSLRALMAAIATDTRLDFESLRVARLLTTLSESVARDGVRSDLYRREADALDCADAARSELLSGYPEGSYSIVAGCTCFFGPPGALADRLPFRDKTHRVLPDRHCTRQSLDADDAVASARATRDDAVDAITRRVCASLHEFESEIHVVETWATALLTLVDHVRAVGSDWTVPYESTDASLRCTGLRPYWLTHGVPNVVSLDPGTPVVVTGPNGGGKSTVLRSLAATAILAQCGLLVPCAQATVPRYSHIFLRSGATDCASERRSSFATEMCDMRTMMLAEGGTLVLVDEPCRGTATADGVRLLKAILEHMPGHATCVVTTHFHELESSACLWMQLTARVDAESTDCTPEYALAPGRCNQSLALQVALHAGMPIDIVRSARHADDEETAVVMILHALGLRYVRMRGCETAPASLRTALYVLMTTQGVYVGETDSVADRIDAHVANKTFEYLFLVGLDNKTQARSIEATVIQELRHCNVRVLSSVDGNHCTHRA